MSEENNKLNRLEELKAKLSSRDYHMKIEHHGTFSPSKGAEIPDSWASEKKEEENFTDRFFQKTPLFKKLFLFSSGFFILALAYAAFTFFWGGNTVSNNNIEIAILGNTFTAGGEELPLQIAITNRNNSPLQLVDLVLEYPKGTPTNAIGDNERIRESLGTIPAGAVRSENVKIILFGEQGTRKQIRVSIEYRVEGSNAIFVKDKVYEVNINSTPINLLADAPTEISPNQDITLDIKASLNATRPAEKILLRVDYPLGFQFVSAKPSPSFGNNAWYLGDLAPGSEQNIQIVGKMLDVFDGEEKTFRIWSGSQSTSDKSAIEVVYNSLAQTVVIKRPFIEAKLYVNGVYQREYAVDTKTPIEGEIRWVNNLETKVNDLEIQAKISGSAVNRQSIDVEGGRFDSLNNTVIWDKNSSSEFREVQPGDSGTVSFSMNTLPSFGSGGSLANDPSISIVVDIEGRQPLEGNAVKSLSNSETKIVRIISDVGFAAKALYYAGPFKNTGPIPPQAEKETTYTVTWTLTNTANNLSKVKIVSSLPPWSRFVGTRAPQAEDVEFNPTTKEITWNVGNLPKGAGITGAGREVSFQIGVLPSLSQVGDTPTIINDAILTAHDDFANVNVRVNKSSLDTRLTNDPAFPPSGDRVVE